MPELTDERLRHYLAFVPRKEMWYFHEDTAEYRVYYIAGTVEWWADSDGQPVHMLGAVFDENDREIMNPSDKEIDTIYEGAIDQWDRGRTMDKPSPDWWQQHNVWIRNGEELWTR